MKMGLPVEGTDSVLLLIVSAAEHCGGVNHKSAPPVVDAVNKVTTEQTKNNEDRLVVGDSTSFPERHQGPVDVWSHWSHLMFARVHSQPNIHRGFRSTEPISERARTLADPCNSEGRGFESHHPHH